MKKLVNLIPYLITVLFFILLATIIIYSVTIKKEVQVEIPNKFIFKAND